MNEITGDLFEVAKNGYDAFCITTNGHVKDVGSLTMGRGTAGLAAERWPDLPYVLGEKTRRKGHMVHVLEAREFGERGRAAVPAPYLVAFPTKPAYTVVDCMRVPGWKGPAKLDLIELSAVELVMAIGAYSWSKVLLPRPGAGAGTGNLPWGDVQELLEHVFRRWKVEHVVDIISLDERQL